MHCVLLWSSAEHASLTCSRTNWKSVVSNTDMIISVRLPGETYCTVRYSGIRTEICVKQQFHATQIYYRDSQFCDVVLVVSDQ
jgi:hypothetical protein